MPQSTKTGRGVQRGAYVLAMSLGMVLAGCAPSSPPRITAPLAVDAFADKPEPLRPLLHRLKVGEARDLVLARMEVGVLSLYYGDLDTAREQFDLALASIETLYADSESARNARSLWRQEGEKDFKGEPYERSMVYYYRGLLYLAEDDFDNAAASFREGVLQDAFAEEEQYRADFALLIFLDGWANQCRGNTSAAQERYAEVRKLRPDFVSPQAGKSVLALAETGRSPRKVADGIGHGELKFRRGRNFAETRARITSVSGDAELYPMEDIFFQASTRGGRPIDAVIAGKVAFRQTAVEVGSILSEASRAVTLAAPVFQGGAGQALGGAGAALGLVSATSLVVAANSGTKADTRYWGGLPDAVHVAVLNAPPQAERPMSYWDEKSSRIEGDGMDASVRVWGGKCKLVWGRSRRPEAAPLPRD